MMISKDVRRVDRKYHADSCGDNLKYYLKDSTLHGLRYVGESTISLFERYLITFYQKNN